MKEALLREGPRIIGAETEYSVYHGSQQLHPQENQAEWGSATNRTLAELRLTGIGTRIAKFLTNGSRFYLDHHGYAEYATPECASPDDAAEAIIAGETVVSSVVVNFAEMTNSKLALQNRVVDSAGNSSGNHENYLGLRHIDFGKYAEALAGHLTTRSIWAGVGAVVVKDGKPIFSMGAKLLDTEGYQSGTTTLEKPIVNSRDEPHANADLWRRIHIICGDSNMLPWANAMKLGTTSLVLRLVENGYMDDDLLVSSPMAALKASSKLNLSSLENPGRLSQVIQAHTIRMRDGSISNPLDLQYRLIEASLDMRNEGYFISAGEEKILEQWIRVCEQLETEPLGCKDRVEWLAKLALAHGRAERNGASLADSLRQIDSGWGLIQPKGFGLRYRERMAPEPNNALLHAPPQNTRAAGRGKLLRDKAESNVGWDTMATYSGTTLGNSNPYDPRVEAWRPK